MANFDVLLEFFKDVFELNPIYWALAGTLSFSLIVIVYSLFGGKKKLPLYAKPLDHLKRKVGETHIYRHPDSFAKLSLGAEGFTNMGEVWQRNFKQYPNQKFLGHRPFKSGTTELEKFVEFMTFSEVKRTVDNLGNGIISQGLAPERREYKNFALKMIAVYSKNSVPYILLDAMACVYGLTTVPIYDTLGEDATEFIFEQTNLTTCFVTCAHVQGLLKLTGADNGFTEVGKNQQRKVGMLKNLVILDEENIGKFKLEYVFDQTAVKCYKFSDVLQAGKRVEDKAPYPKFGRDHVYCFSYTSGTTGEPKGALISHGNMLAMLVGLSPHLDLEDDALVHLSYLPLAHVYERINLNYVCWARGSYVVFNGDILKLKEDLAIVQPTLFGSVPRLFNRFYDTIKARTDEAKGIKKFLFDKAFAAKMHNLVTTGSVTHWFWDRLVFGKIKATLFPKTGYFTTGSAPISNSVKNFLQICFCVPMIEAYGQTEGTGGEFVTAKLDPTFGHVGGPIVCNEFKLVDVPDMKYTSQDKDEKGRLQPRGEIWVRGTNVIQGYYKNHEKTLESIDEDNWLHSGDIGMILPGTNAQKICDRRKALFKLSQGEYISPEKLEQSYKLNKYIDDIFVYGDSLYSCVVAILNINVAEVTKLCKAEGISEESLKDPSNNPKLKKLLQAKLDETAKTEQLKGFEKVKDVYVDVTPFAEKNPSLLTTTMKMKRNDAKDAYLPQIVEMYKKLN